jgi:AcrR family transcriptional regulator
MGIPIAQRRRALAEAALRVMARDGVPAASVRAIAAEAGVALASVHYAYASRSELLREAVRLVVAEERAAAYAPTTALPEGDGPADLSGLLGDALRAYLAHLRGNPGREQAMLELTHAALRTPELDGVAREQYLQYYSLVTELLTLAEAACAVRWSVPLDVLARMIVTFTDGLTMQWLAAPDESSIHRQIDLFVAALTASAAPAVAEAAR